MAQAIQRDNVEGDTLTTPDNVVEQIALVEQRELKSTITTKPSEEPPVDGFSVDIAPQRVEIVFV